jgi:sugar O-acyltransferase (sialic acid O-acetyltransferase NeuD family)
VGLRFQVGETLKAGEILAYLGSSPDAHDPTLPPWSKKPESTQSTPLGLRITEPARELAAREGLNLSELPQEVLVTEAVVKEIIRQKHTPKTIERPEGENRILVYGCGGHGRSLAALIQTLNQYDVIGFLDDGYSAGQEVAGIQVLGGMAELPNLYASGLRLGVNGVGGISDPASRLNVYQALHESGFFCPTLIHPTAFLEESAALADGVQVFPMAYVGTHVQVDFGCIINTGAIISHDCHLAKYVNLSPGATLAGGVTVGEESLIGMRATINLGVKVGRKARIGNGATVKGDVPDGGVVPAGTIWPPRH